MKAISFKDSPEFTQENEYLILSDMPGEEKFQAKCGQYPDNCRHELRYLYQTPLLNRQQETHLFRKMNFLKKLYNENNDDFILNEIHAIRNRLIEANVRMAYSAIKKNKRKNITDGEVVSEATMFLIRAIDGFDYTIGNKFSTYAIWAINRGLWRFYQNNTLPERQGSENFTLNDVPQREDYTLDTEENVQIVELVNELDDRTKQILYARFGIDQEEHTLESIGKRFGMTKERVRQIQNDALAKLKKKLSKV